MTYSFIYRGNFPEGEKLKTSNKKFRLAKYILQMCTDKELLMFNILRLPVESKQIDDDIKLHKELSKELDYIKGLVVKYPLFMKVLNSVRIGESMTNGMSARKQRNFFRYIDAEVDRLSRKIIKYEEYNRR